MTANMRHLTESTSAMVTDTRPIAEEVPHLSRSTGQMTDSILRLGRDINRMTTPWT